jgi:hypothetical protein
VGLPPKVAFENVGALDLALYNRTETENGVGQAAGRTLLSRQVGLQLIATVTKWLKRSFPPLPSPCSVRARGWNAPVANPSPNPGALQDRAWLGHVTP